MNRPNSNINSALDILRKKSWGVPEGEFIGTEEDLTRSLEASRPTVRQAARLLEREGLLRVKRGINGGYFSARPDEDVIEASVSAYLTNYQVDFLDACEFAATLWVVMVRRASRLPQEVTSRELASARDLVEQVPPDAPFESVAMVEEVVRDTIMELTQNPYYRLIFHINKAFSKKYIKFDPAKKNNTDEHKRFVHSWRLAQLQVIDTVMLGDTVLAELAARNVAKLFFKRVFDHDPYGTSPL